MNVKQIHCAATFLKQRRVTDNRQRLPMELRPKNCSSALAIQLATSQVINDRIGGWKVGLPVDGGLIVAPVFTSTIHSSLICAAKTEKGVCRIEPEIAFVIKKDLLPRIATYTDEEIKESVSSVHLAIELLENRYQGKECLSHYENLADCLYNQGICLGPEIELEAAVNIGEFELTLTQNEKNKLTACHPNQSPIIPLYWLVEFLSKQGKGLKAGDVIITGSLAGVLEVAPNLEFTLEYSHLGKFSLKIQV